MSRWRVTLQRQIGAPTGPEWYRGPAHLIDGEWLQLSDPQPYLLSPGPMLPFELSWIRTPEEAVVFATRHGLLRCSPEDVEQRERFSDWQQAVADMAGIIGLRIAVVQAADGDLESIAYLRRFYNEALQDTYGSLANNCGVPEEEIIPIAQVERYISDVLNTWLLNVGVQTGTGVEVDDDQGETRSGLFWRWVSPDLLTAAWQQLAQVIIEGDEIRSCEHCGRPFLVTDQRQRFHDRSCARRQRYQKAQQQREAILPVDGKVDRV